MFTTPGQTSQLEPASRAHMPRANFSAFAFLPAELRYQIWEQSIEESSILFIPDRGRLDKLDLTMLGVNAQDVCGSCAEADRELSTKSRFQKEVFRRLQPGLSRNISFSIDYTRTMFVAQRSTETGFRISLRWDQAERIRHVGLAMNSNDPWPSKDIGFLLVWCTSLVSLTIVVPLHPIQILAKEGDVDRLMRGVVDQGKIDASVGDEVDVADPYRLLDKHFKPSFWEVPSSLRLLRVRGQRPRIRVMPWVKKGTPDHEISLLENPNLS